MKATILFLASTLVFLVTSPALASRITLADDLVYDYKNKPVEIGATYRIGTVSSGVRGYLGLVNSSTGNDCEKDVGNLPYDNLHPGSRFTFTPTSGDTIRVGAALGIRAREANLTCAESKTLKVSTPPVGIITTGGCFDTPNSCFRIVKPLLPSFPGAYSFEYSPNLCGAAEKLFYEVGLQYRNGNNLLSTNPEIALEFIIFKVKSVDVS